MLTVTKEQIVRTGEKKTVHEDGRAEIREEVAVHVSLPNGKEIGWADWLKPGEPVTELHARVASLVLTRYARNFHKQEV